MEAEVYAYGPDAVLKLYAGTASLADLRILRGFYDSLDRQRVLYRWTLSLVCRQSRQSALLECYRISLW